MASPSFQSERSEVDTVCGTLCAKLETKNLSCGSSCCIFFGGKVFTPCKFEHHTGKSAYRNWKSSIRCCGNPLSSHIELYETPDGKKQWHFVMPEQNLCPSVSSKPSLMTSQQNDVAPVSVKSLPALVSQLQGLFRLLPMHMNLTWGDLDGPAVCKKLVDCYREAVRWKRSLFDLPSNNRSRVFTFQLTRLFNAFAEGSSMELIFLTAAMLFPILILQKPTGKLKSKVVYAHIQRCLGLLAAGDFDSLMIEGRTIQTHLSFHAKPNHSQLSQTFPRLMFSGKVKAALRLLSNSATTVKPLSLDNLLPSDKSVREVLREKHPTNQPVAADAVLSSTSL